MSTSVYNKSTRRTIKSTLGRFLSIFFISFLGAGVLAGLMAVAPNMREEGDAYYDKYSVMDVRMLSTFGFDEEDVKAIRKLDGVSGVMPGYTIDATGTVGDKDYTFRLNSLPVNNSSKNDELNKLNVIEGHLPENDNEVIVLRPSTGLKNITLGDQISLDKTSNGRLSETINDTNYKIVGIAEAPYYLSFQQGSTSVGGGSIDFVLYAPHSSFISDVYTELFVGVTGAKYFNTFTDSYKESVDATIKNIEKLAKERQGLRRDQFQQEIANARQEYTDKKQEAEAKLENANKLISQGRVSLEKAEKDYSSGWAEYERRKAAADLQFTQAKAQLDASQAAIDSAEATLKEAIELYNTQRAQYEAWVAATGMRDPIIEAQLAAAQVAIEKNTTELNAKQYQLQAKRQEYETAKSQAESELRQAYSKLNAARIQISKKGAELAQKQIEYEDGRDALARELNNAQQKIDTAQRTLDDLGEPKWYVLDRETNEGYVVYRDDIVRMERLATVFPVVFYLVALLVCLTTMTRMVDEDRILIGTFKALGYSNKQIAGRYLRYAMLASVPGSIVGTLFGFWLLPTIIWNAYGIVFALPEMNPRVYLAIASITVIITTLVIAFATLMATRHSLQESPASLMLPKAPKKGKRVWLERIGPVWRRLSFSWKVTVRNIGLNKKRLALSLVGIIGCTALVVTALGARHAVSLIIDGQFSEISHYDATINYTGGELSRLLKERMSDKNYITSFAEATRTATQVTKEEQEKEGDNVFLVSPKDAATFDTYVTLRDPATGKDINFNNDSVIITEKLSLNLGVVPGDTIWLQYYDDEVKRPVVITDITKNYAFNYVYIGKDAYTKAFKTPPVYDKLFAILNSDRTSDEIREHLKSVEGVGAISFVDDLMGNIRTSITSVTMIIWILIGAAGTLAFVVLYNLIDINIGERQREIATLKVLGFYNRETFSYIFRETIILSIIGAGLGLVLGVWLYRAVITTVEPDVLLLTRNLSWVDYLISGVLILIFTLVVNQFMKPKIRNIDMLESLKSVE